MASPLKRGFPDSRLFIDVVATQLKLLPLVAAVTAISGTATGAISNFGGSAAGTVAIAGTATGAVANFGGSAVGTVAIAGTATGAIANFGGSAAGTVAVGSVANGFVNPLAGSAAGTVAIACAGSGAIQSLAGSAVGVLPIVGTATGAIANLGGSGVGGHVSSGVATGAIQNLAGSALGTVLATTVDMTVVPVARRTVWAPGIPGGIPNYVTIHTTIDAAVYGTGVTDARLVIQNALTAAGAAYLIDGVGRVVLLPAGTYRTTQALLIPSGVVLRGAGFANGNKAGYGAGTGAAASALTRIRLDSPDGWQVLHIGRQRFTDYGASFGPWNLAASSARGDTTITLSNADAAHVLVGDILCIDEEDDLTFVKIGDAVFQKRQSGGDTQGPALRLAGKWRSVTQLIRIKSKAAPGAANTVITLEDPLKMAFRTGQFAQVFHCGTAFGDDVHAFPNANARGTFDGVWYAGAEDLYVTGGNNNQITTNNVAFCWLKNVECDGNPATANIGTYTNQAGYAGVGCHIFHAYRFEMRQCYIHHARNINPGGGAYGLGVDSYTSESLFEDNISYHNNKVVVCNMMGGGNVIAYNYTDDGFITNSPGWQEGIIDLCHQSYTHNCLVEGNWSANLVTDDTHGNAGFHMFYRNYGNGQNSNPPSADTGYMRAAGPDGNCHEHTYIANVLRCGAKAGATKRYELTTAQAVGGTIPHWTDPAVWRVGGGVNGDGGGQGTGIDDGTALANLYRHLNYDDQTAGLVNDGLNAVQSNPPPSMYLLAAPSFFSGYTWPWVNPEGANDATRVRTLPAKARFDATAIDSGIATGAVQSLAGAGVGKVAISGAANGFINTLGGTATGGNISVGTATGAVQNLAGSATGLVSASSPGVVQGVGSGTLQSLAGSAAAQAMASAVGSGSVNSLAGVAVAKAQAVAAGTGAVQNLAGSATGLVSAAAPGVVQGVGSGALQSIAGSAVAFHGLNAVGVGAISKLAGAATGSHETLGLGVGAIRELAGSAEGVIAGVQPATGLATGEISTLLGHATATSIAHYVLPTSGGFHTSAKPFGISKTMSEPTEEDS